jgi:hypothetical protein
MTHHPESTPPVNRWASLVKRSIHQPGSLEWLESNIGNFLRAALHDCGHWDAIDYIFPKPVQENHWLFDFETNSFMGYFLSQCEGHYGYWSHHYAYRSHFFQIFADPEKQSYYSTGDPPEYVIEALANQGIEVVRWGKFLQSDHPLLRKAKAECQTLNPPLCQSVVTAIWQQSTPDTFLTEWEALKATYLNQQ